MCPTMTNQRNVIVFRRKDFKNTITGIQSGGTTLLLIVMALSITLCLHLSESLITPAKLLSHKIHFKSYDMTGSKSRLKSFTTMWLFSNAPTTVIRAKELTEQRKEINVQLQIHRNASIARLFGKLAEDRVIMDVSQGKCCFSGCPGCDFYNDDGTYQYSEIRTILDDDSIKARPESLLAKSKLVAAVWIPAYSYRSVGGTNTHTAKWKHILFPTEQDKTLSKELFCQRLFEDTDGAPINFPVLECEDVILTFPPKFGLVNISDANFLINSSILLENSSLKTSTKLIQKTSREQYDKEAIDILWELLTTFSGVKDASSLFLTKGQFINRVKKWTINSSTSLDGLSFSSFATRMLTAMQEK